MSTATQTRPGGSPTTVPRGNDLRAPLTAILVLAVTVAALFAAEAAGAVPDGTVLRDDRI